MTRLIVNGDSALDYETIRRLSKELGMYYGDIPYFCVVVKYGEGIEMSSTTELPASLYKLCLLATRELKIEAESFVGTHMCVVVLLHGKNNERQHIVKRFADSLQAKSLYPVQIGVGKSYEDPEKICYSRVEAYEALRNTSAKQWVFYIDDVYMIHSITAHTQEREKRKVIELFKTGMLKEMNACLGKVVEDIRKNTPIRENSPYPSSIRRTIVELMVEIIHIASDSDVDVDAVMNYQDPYSHIFALNSTPLILDWFLEMTTKLYDGMLENKTKRESSIMQIAKECIHNNIHDPNLCLTMVSEAVDLTPTYLSAFFIKEVGMGFNEYISSLRMEKAKLMLEQTNKKISTIAEECGFRSASYFNAVFRKWTGISPGAYRISKK